MRSIPPVVNVMKHGDRQTDARPFTLPPLDPVPHTMRAVSMNNSCNLLPSCRRRQTRQNVDWADQIGRLIGLIPPSRRLAASCKLQAAAADLCCYVELLTGDHQHRHYRQQLLTLTL